MMKSTTVISALAVGMSGLALGWNVYRDIIAKARLKAYVTIVNAYSAGLGASVGDYVKLTGVNHGPGAIICENIFMRDSSLIKRLLRKSRMAQILPTMQPPFGDSLPKKLQIGETITLLLPYSDSFLACNPTHLGISDSFGNIHWVPSKNLRDCVASYLTDNPEKKWEDHVH